MERTPGEIRLTRAELYARVWSIPMRQLASEFGVSDVGLSKFCRRNGIPTPPQGYWMMAPAKQAQHQRPLGDDPPAEQMLTIHPPPTAHPHGAPKPRIEVVVPAELVKPRPIVAATARALRCGTRGDDGLLTPSATPDALPVGVGRDSIARAAKILQALFDCLEQRGHTCAPKPAERGSLFTVTVAGEEVSLALGEEVDRAERALTVRETREKEQYPWMYRQPRYTYTASGRLFLKMDHYCTGLRKHWADGKRQRVEACLGDFVAQLETVAAQMKADRLEREKANQRRQAWELERAQKLRQIQEEEERLKTLNAQVDAWHGSERIRHFADAVRAAFTDGTLERTNKLEQWLDWVYQQADRLDPLVESPSSILDEKKRYESYYYSES